MEVKKGGSHGRLVLLELKTLVVIRVHVDLRIAAWKSDHYIQKALTQQLPWP